MIALREKIGKASKSRLEQAVKLVNYQT